MIRRTRKFQNLALAKPVSPLASFYLNALLLISCFALQATASLERGDVNDHEKSNLIGCLFADDLCNSEEICFDDLAFGKCISTLEPDNNDLYRYDTFSEEASDFLELELDQLKNNGYTWSDDYSQCIVQIALNAIRFDAEFDSTLCDEFKIESNAEDSNNNNDDNNIEPRLEKKDDEAGDDDQPPVHKSLKVWTDNPDDPHALAYKASEVSDSIPGFYAVNEQDGSILIDPQDSGVQIMSENKAESEKSYNIPIDFENNLENSLENSLENNLGSQLDQENDIQEEILDPADFLMNYEVPSEDEIIFPRESFDEQSLDLTNDELPIETRALETPIHLQGIDDNDVLYRHKFGYEKRSLSPSEDDVTDSDDAQNFVESSGQETGNPEFFFIPSDGSNSDDLIFNRNERFDVKKPGPFFPNSANNFFLNKIIGDEEGSDEKDGLDKQDPFGPRDNPNSEQKGQIEVEQPMLAPVKDKRLLPVFDNVINQEEDGKNFVHIILKKRLQTWMQGSNMIRHLAQELGIPEEALTERRIEDQHVQFRVEPNPLNINAEAMANALGEDHDIKKRVEDKLGVDIHKVIAGQQNEYQSALFTGSVDPNLLLGLTVAVATTCVLVVSIFALILIKRRRKQLRLKQNQLEQEEEDSRLRDQYSQLCRDWSNTSKPTSGADNLPIDNTASKPNDGTKVTPIVTKKISSRDSSKDIEGSNRSSTSSGPDEPSASNMDISTGHMVLAYMEDHLKNKQRLEQEWVALCGYEAEPCATTVAFKAENKKKNRYPDKLPYDHNRVILNAVLNKNNSDYINASTVTDHDPRNPPYIVTQGPLSQTVADFWQMVWEQGCVVIVMLSRLQDNGYHLCHRYWPEEGSEKYHIFEVHLVSEHVWCDDYLVRSVYLKNTRTGETRTVTQFHFRSWPAHGVPTSTKALLEFRRKVNKSYRGRSCPIIVHCSDGVGRSGTYILIDMVLNRMAKGCKEIDIAATLEHIRDQRGGMVQTRQQFEFCLMAVAEEVHAILKALPQ